MLSKVVKRSFSLSSLMGSLKRNALAPVKHIKRVLEPTAQDYTTMTNTTEDAFDEVSHEW